jgi:hypothetical protein
MGIELACLRCAPPVYGANRWTGMDVTLGVPGRLALLHGLLAEVYPKYVESFARPQGGAEEAAGAAGTREQLLEAEEGQEGVAGPAEEPQEEDAGGGAAGDDLAGAGPVAAAEWQLLNDWSRRLVRGATHREGGGS